jgi:hypothetical protein
MYDRFPFEVPMRVAAALLPILLAAPAASGLAQASRTSARPTPRSGVLLGVAGHGTLWIAPDSTGRIRVLGPSVDLIVRRDTTFWRIAVVDAQLEEDTLVVADDSGAVAGDSAGGSAESMAVAADSSGDPGCGDGPECAEPGDWFAAAIVAAPADAEDPVAVLRSPPSRLGELREAEGARDLAITFAGADWVAWTEYFETAGPLMNASNDARILRIDSLAARPFVLDDERSDAPLAFDAAAESRHRRECAKQYVRSDSRMVEYGELFAWPRRSFFLQHLSGRWRVVQRFSMGTGALRGFVFDCVLSDVVPASIVAHDRLSPSWAEIRRQIPAATDAVSSPSGDLVVVASDEWLRVYAPRAGRLGAPIADLPMHFPHIVMAQWAAEGELARWTRELAPHLEGDAPR